MSLHDTTLRPSTAPHAQTELATKRQAKQIIELREFRSDAVEAFQGIRTELDELHAAHERYLSWFASIALRLPATRPSRWDRFVCWFRRNVYATS